MKKILLSIITTIVLGLTPVLALADTGYGRLNETIGISKTLSVGLSGGSWSVSSNSNPNVAGVSVVGLNVIIKGQAAGSSQINICERSGGCLEINLAVSAVLGAFTSAHQSGSWVLGPDSKTVYYITSSGIIPITTWKIFLNNGGKQNLIVPINEADQTLPLLSVMTLNDTRVK